MNWFKHYSVTGCGRRNLTAPRQILDAEIGSRTHCHQLMRLVCKPFHSSAIENLVPRVGLEPTLLSELDFESSASTTSATEAFVKKHRLRISRHVQKDVSLLIRSPFTDPRGFAPHTHVEQLVLCELTKIWCPTRDSNPHPEGLEPKSSAYANFANRAMNTTHPQHCYGRRSGVCRPELLW